ncbi:tellurite resistance protein TerA [Streptomyces zhaozhouensis]|uniref:Tellurite resistance protein TerA n=1 Tax=Streptomyces zhaozhouensis TaxID=1300267 RepID=A0A286DNH2_9ACTN|nr:Tellurium resistance [Streptomyces zhaozhouensis]SOD60245.1 tellurite resistance protein TerA [Streptomyces zhaozhouensis]
MVSLWSYWRGGASNQRFDTVGGPMSYASELTRRSPEAVLTSEGSDTGTLRVDLTWRIRSNSDFGRSQRKWMDNWRHPLEVFKPAEIKGHSQGVANMDFDLACMYELSDGTRGVVQSLGGLQGDFNEAPYIKLSGDDRFGTGSGEHLYINLDNKDDFKRLLVFVYIYDGAPTFDRADVTVTLATPDGKNVEVGCTDPPPQARSCAVVLIEKEKDHLVARRQVKYVYGFQSEIDRLYGWGMSWGRGRK